VIKRTAEYPARNIERNSGLALKEEATAKITMTHNLEWKKTHCARMDHGGCALKVCVQGNRILKIKGDPDGYLNHGYICPKALASADRLHHPARLKYPLKRSGKRGDGKWTRISWTEALAEISSRLNEIKAAHGAKSVAFGQGMPKGMEHFTLIRLANLFGSPNVVSTQDVCHSPREVSGLHTCGFYPVADFHHKSDLVLLWGSNITATNEEGEICSLLVKQLRQGTKLIIVDPRKTVLSGRSEHWLQVQPGTDHALALAFLNVIIAQKAYDKDFVASWTTGFDELAEHVRTYPPEKMAAVTQIPADTIIKAALAYARAPSAVIQWGNPLEHHVHSFSTIRALLCLMALCGNLDIPGGNVHALDPEILPLRKFVRLDLYPDKVKEMISTHHRTLPRFIAVPSAFFREAVLKQNPYPIKAAYFQCTNPLLVYADSSKTCEALMKLDFLAVSDIFMTPTAALADIVLPAATHFEFNDIGHYGLGHGYILARPRVVDPPKECWPDIKILNELGKALTPATYWFDDHQDLLESVLSPSGLNYQAFAKAVYLKGPERFQKYRDKGFKTPSGKVELFLSTAAENGFDPLPVFKDIPNTKDPQYPLTLTSTKDRFYLHSSYRWIARLRKSSPAPEAEIHPQTAAAYGIRQGEPMVIETLHGAITQSAHITDHIMPGVVSAAYGWWFPEGSPEDQFDWRSANFNMLTSMEALGKEFGTPNLKGIGCRIRRA
jgi:anaerobic selenocysteine-containing dehydrogenase